MNARGRAKRNVWKDTKAVSPVIAVLILIIVAVVGAVAVGLLQTQIKERAEGQAEFGDVGTHELKIIGGPGVSMMMAGPVEAGGSVTSDEAPEGTFLHEFAKKHPEIKVEFLRECCGFAMYALPIEACDMGIGRRFPTDPEKAAYPELQFKVVGKAPIAVITRASNPIRKVGTITVTTAANMTNYTALRWAYSHINASADNITAYAFDPSHKTLSEWEGGAGQAPPGEVYGTSIQGMFSLYLKRGPSADAWILGGAEDNLWLNDEIMADSSNYTLVNSQEEMIEHVATTNCSLGFVDYMYAVNAMEEGKDIIILGLDNKTYGIDGKEPDDSPEGIGTADTTNSFGGEGYVTGFGGPMFTPVMVFTYGEPDPYEQAVIDSLQMFEGVEVLTEHGFLAGENIVVSATCPFHTE